MKICSSKSCSLNYTHQDKVEDHFLFEEKDFIIIFENINLGLVGFDETCPVAESLTVFTGDSGPRGPVREVGLTL